MMAGHRPSNGPIRRDAGGADEQRAAQGREEDGSWASPCRNAKATAAARLSQPVFWKMAVRWLMTVFWLRPRASAMARLLCPATTSRRTWTWRALSPAGRSGGSHEAEGV